MLTESGAKVLDFGIAMRFGGADPEAATRSTIAMTGRQGIAGTLPYMAPEVLGGESASERSDLWSLGVLIYEALTGKRPFGGKNGAEITSAIVRDRPGPLPTHCPAQLAQVVLRCLEKEPRSRYRRASEFRAAVETASAVVETGPSNEPRGFRPGLVAAVSAASAFVVLVGVYFASWSQPPPQPLDSGAPTAVTSIAVLPFENLSNDPDQDYFADGVHEALITDLSKLDGLTRVIARASVLAYVDSDESLPAIAEQLGVDAVMTGTVLRVDDKVRITGQLVDGRSETILWAERYDRDLSDVLTLQNEIVTAIAREIELHLTPEDERRLSRASPVDPEAHDLYLLGRQQALTLTAASIERAIEYFHRAIALDPEFALAHAGLAWAYYRSENWGGGGIGMRTEEARASAMRAVELDPTVADGHALLATLRYARDWDWAGAEEAFRRALELNPNHSRTHMEHSFFLTTMGRLDEAVAATARTIELDPQSPGLRSSHGRQLHRARRYDEAIAVYQRALEFDPTNRAALGRLAEAYLQVGQHDAAQAQVDRIEQLYGEEGVLDRVRGRLYFATGRTEEALAIAGAGRGFTAAVIYAEAGFPDEALSVLEAGVEARSFGPFTLRDPGFDAIRDDPRFEALLRRAGLPIVRLPAAR